MATGTKKTQTNRVQQYIENFGSITSLEAIRDLGVTRLSAVVFKLKKAGLQVEGVTEHAFNRFGEKTAFKRYYIADNKPQNAARL